MQKTNFLKQKLESGKAVLGTWSVIPNPIVSDIISSAGLDFVIIDSEHGPISFETAQQMIISCESRGTSPVMRVGSINEADILKAMDIGVHCIQIPNVSNADDVKKIVEYSKYPPAGKRGFSPFTRAGNYNSSTTKNLIESGINNTLIAINIEDKEAILNIDSILNVDFLDIVFIGLFDLSKALGIPGDVDNPLVFEELEKLTKKITRAGKYPGTIVTSDKNLQKFLNLDIRYLVYLVDCHMIFNAYNEKKKIFDNLTQSEI